MNMIYGEVVKEQQSQRNKQKIHLRIEDGFFMTKSSKILKHFCKSP